MTRADLVILVDVDNTLLDNDALKARLDDDLHALLGGGGARRFWATYEDVRASFGLVDIPQTVARFAASRTDLEQALSRLVFALPFADFVYPRAFDVLAHLDALGTTVVFSDGDERFQREKIRASGIEDAVAGRVLVFPHKEQAIAETRRAHPAAAYAVLDDKPAILAAMKRELGGQVTTVFVRQGRYADAAPAGAGSADLTLAAIDDALTLSASDVLQAARAPER